MCIIAMVGIIDHIVGVPVRAFHSARRSSCRCITQTPADAPICGCTTAIYQSQTIRVRYCTFLSFDLRFFLSHLTYKAFKGADLSILSAFATMSAAELALAKVTSQPRHKHAFSRTHRTMHNQMSLPRATEL
jgi:hypothetical protein